MSRCRVSVVTQLPRTTQHRAEVTVLVLTALLALLALQQRYNTVDPVALHVLVEHQ